ncbi:hypothetical protein RDV84_04435 [Lysobacter yananisis]|uniref:Secreted protein n=1 Tax=Lysobacter yananisis TaxID=1003114 RepID=A0ABY9PFS5_9GAMM|nr:hypothetical protein [Lysobacter yananisis]WMT05928.1 hypothetical protein RDV84_04435 [Lysobacter yananisis]
MGDTFVRIVMFAFIYALDLSIRHFVPLSVPSVAIQTTAQHVVIGHEPERCGSTMPCGSSNSSSTAPQRQVARWTGPIAVPPTDRMRVALTGLFLGRGSVGYTRDAWLQRPWHQRVREALVRPLRSQL